MVRKFFKKAHSHSSLQKFIKKYKIPRAHISVNRKNVARAIFIGIFIGLIPMPGQMIVVIFLIPFIRFNAPIALFTVWLSNPFTMPFIYYTEYVTGSFFLGAHLPAVHMTIKWFGDNFKHIFIPLYLGTLFYSVSLSFVGYYLVNHLWRRSVHKEKYHKTKQRLNR